MITTRGRVAPALLATTLALLAACGSDTPTNALPSELQALKEATTPYQDITAAEAAGYDTPLTPCWYDHAQGGMGIHYGNVNLIDGTPSLMHPEVLIYEPQSDHSLKLVALEYLVPIDAWSGTSPPSLEGQAFTRDDALGVYELHLWLWEDNPKGMYFEWNPNVSCQYATDSEDQATLVAPASAVVKGVR